VLFIGTPPLRLFSYKEMRQFARRAIEIIREQQLPVWTLTTTVHGAGYGLDIEESVQAMVFGFQQGLAACTSAIELQRIVFVERNQRRFELLHSVLKDVRLAPAKVAASALAPPSTVTPPPKEPAKKKRVFVAMPFLEEFDDV
jgi:hypothetical protein